MGHKIFGIEFRIKHLIEFRRIAENESTTAFATVKPTKTTTEAVTEPTVTPTINPFWKEWSPMQPTSQDDNLIIGNDLLSIFEMQSVEQNPNNMPSVPAKPLDIEIIKTEPIFELHQVPGGGNGGSNGGGGSNLESWKVALNALNLPTVGEAINKNALNERYYPNI